MDRLRLLATGLVCFCAGGLYGWSALITPLQAAFDVTTAQTGLVFSIAIVCFTLSVIIAPLLLQRMGALRRLAVFAAGGAVCVALASVAPSYVLFVVFFSAGFGTCSGAIYISCLGIAASSAKPLQTTPMMVAAFGMGGAVFGPVWRMLQGSELGLSMLLPLACGLGACAVMAWRLCQGNASFQAADTAKGGDPLEHAQPGTLPLIWLIFAFGSFGGLMVLGLAAKMLESAGASLAMASVTLAGIALGNTLGRLSVAGLTHITRPISCAVIAICIGGFGMVVALFGATTLALALGICLIAGGYGVLASAVPSLTRAIYGAAAFQRRFALVFSAWGVAGFCAPWIGGAVYDATGSFDIATSLALGATAIAGLTIWALSVRLRHRL